LIGAALLFFRGVQMRLDPVRFELFEGDGIGRIEHANARPAERRQVSPNP
jgi:hypothetical protein